MLKLNDFTTLPGYRENVMTFFLSPLKRQFDKGLSKKKSISDPAILQARRVLPRLFLLRTL